MMKNIRSEEYILPEIITGILHFIPFQSAVQVSIVNKDFKTAIGIYQEYRANRMAIRIQRCFRRWRNREFLREIGVDLVKDLVTDFSYDDPFGPPVLWRKYFATSVGKRYGKALFKAHFTKFINPIVDESYWDKVIFHMSSVFSWENPSPTELEIITKVEAEFVNGNSSPKKLALRLIDEVLIPHMDREGYGLLYRMWMIFGNTLPMFWENYRDVKIEFFSMYNDEEDL